MRADLAGGEALASQPARVARRHLMAAAAAIAFILLVAFVLPLPPWEGQPNGPPPAEQPAAAGMGVLGFALGGLFALALLLPFRPYVLALRAVAGRRVSGRLLFGLTVLVALAGLAIYPRFGTDLWEYVAYARLWRVYGENPLLATPAMHPTDWAVAVAWHPERGNAYGPLWQVLTWPIGAAGGDSITAQTIGYKLLAAAGYAACVGLLWQACPSDRRARAVIGFAWNPLVLFDVLGKVHNDVIPAALVLLALLLVRSGPAAGGLLAIAAATLVKASAASGGPALLKRLAMQRRWGQLAAGLAAGLALTLTLYLPFWSGWRTFEALRSQVGQVDWSPGSVLLLATESISGTPQDAAVRSLLVGTWLAAVAALLRWAPVERDDDLAASVCLFALITPVLLTTAFYAHYLVPAIALAALSGKAWLERLVLWLSVGSLGAYAVAVLALAFGSVWLGSPAYRLAGSLVSFGPALLLVAWWWLRPQRRATRHAQRGLAT